MSPTGFRTFHFVSFLYILFFSFAFLLFRLFSYCFVFVFCFSFFFLFSRYFSHCVLFFFLFVSFFFPFFNVYRFTGTPLLIHVSFSAKIEALLFSIFKPSSFIYLNVVSLFTLSGLCCQRKLKTFSINSLIMLFEG